MKQRFDSSNGRRGRSSSDLLTSTHFQRITEKTKLFFPSSRRKLHYRKRKPFSNLYNACVLVTSLVLVVTILNVTRRSSLTSRHGTRGADAMSIYSIQHTFPVHAQDFEEIPHPATVFSSASFPEDLPKTLEVPRFWNPPEYGGDARQYLGNGTELMTKETASSIGSFHNDKETIYVGIASYRDPECINTLESIYLRAKFPERIRTVVIEQRREEDPHCTIPTEFFCEDDPEHFLCKYSHLIDSYELDARLAVGPTFARHLSNRYYRGEYFALQVDAHVRFVKHWDESIIWQWKLAKNEMAVLTTYLLDLNGAIDPVTFESHTPGRSLLCNTDFEGDYLRHGQQPPRPSGRSDEPTLHPFWAAGFSFSRGHFVVSVPYDAYLPNVFQGEEYSMGLRGFTYGYDYYSPEHLPCFHMYALHKNRENRLAVPHFWENEPIFGSELVGEAMKRLVGILDGNIHEYKYNLIEEEKYGLGRIRSTDKFYRTFGIHVHERRIENHLCWFVGDMMQKTLLPALTSMGIDYSLVDYEFVDPAPDQP